MHMAFFALRPASSHILQNPILSKIPACSCPSFAVHAAASARGMLYSQVPSPSAAMGIRTGRCKLPRWVVYKWHLAAPRSALLAKQQSTCHGWQNPDGKGETLPENRSDIFQGPTLPIRVAMVCCQIITLPVRPHLPSICSRADNPRGGRIDPFFARTFAASIMAAANALRSVRAVSQRCRADAACSCVPPDFRLSPHGRVRPEDDELSVHPAIRSGIGRMTPAGPKPCHAPPVAAGGIAARPRDRKVRVTLSTPAPVPPRRNALRCIRGRNGAIVAEVGRL